MYTYPFSSARGLLGSYFFGGGLKIIQISSSSPKGQFQDLATRRTNSHRKRGRKLYSHILKRVLSFSNFLFISACIFGVSFLWIYYFFCRILRFKEFRRRAWNSIDASPKQGQIWIYDVRSCEGPMHQSESPKGQR